MNRAGVMRALWAAVREIPNGEDVLRDAVAQSNTRHGANLEHKGTPEFCSTRNLSNAQLVELANQLRASANLPRRAPRPPDVGPRGGRSRRKLGPGIVALASPSELAWAEELFRALEFDEAAQLRFVQRQCKSDVIRTHKQATALITPLESMALRRGFVIVEERRVKTLRRPGGP